MNIRYNVRFPHTVINGDKFQIDEKVYSATEYKTFDNQEEFDAYIRNVVLPNLK